MCEKKLDREKTIGNFVSLVDDWDLETLLEFARNQIRDQLNSLGDASLCRVLKAHGHEGLLVYEETPTP